MPGRLYLTNVYIQVLIIVGAVAAVVLGLAGVNLQWLIGPVLGVPLLGVGWAAIRPRVAETRRRLREYDTVVAERDHAVQAVNDSRDRVAIFEVNSRDAFLLGVKEGQDRYWGAVLCRELDLMPALTARVIENGVLFLVARRAGDRYFNNTETAVAIVIGDVFPLLNQLPLHEWDVARPPQSYQYLALGERGQHPNLISCVLTGEPGPALSDAIQPSSRAISPTGRSLAGSKDAMRIAAIELEPDLAHQPTAS